MILLHIGTNDMVRGNQDAAADLDALLDRIAADRAGRPGLRRQDRRAGRLRRHRRRSATARTSSTPPSPASWRAKGPNFHVVDDSDVHGIDMWNREHPNDYGYQKMAWNWYRALEPVLNPAGPAWPAADEPVPGRLRLPLPAAVLARHRNARAATSGTSAATSGSCR